MKKNNYFIIASETKQSLNPSSYRDYGRKIFATIIRIKNYFKPQLLLICFLFLSIFSCTPELKAPEASSGSANFSKVIAIGGNYMAGYQDGALYQKAQRFCIPALLAEQFKLVGGTFFNQALMPDNNGLGLNQKPWESIFNTPSHLTYKTDCKGITALSPIKNSISIAGAIPYLTGIAGNSIQNIAVPFATTSDYFNPAFGNTFSSGNKNPFYNRIASTPSVSSIYSDARMQNATFFMAWIGMENIFNYASAGGVGTSIESSTNFSLHLDTLLNALTANGAKGVIATIPDFRTMPYYTLFKWNNANLTKSQADSLNDTYASSGLNHIHFNEGNNSFVIADSLANGGVRQIHNGEYITLSVPIDSVKCNKYGLLINAINNRYVLDSAEVFTIDNSIALYNSVITQKASQYNLALVDMSSYFNSVNSGIKWNGVDYNSTFVSGGFFSLDGYHPNQKGYALIANEFLKAINSKYNAVIPTINCVECDGIIFP